MDKKFTVSAAKRIDRALHISRGRKAAEIALAVCCFALPVLFLPSALHESRTGLWVRVGLPKLTVKTVLASGCASSLQYALATGKGVYRSIDNGMTWLAANSGLPSDVWGRSAVQALAVDESNPSLAYAGIGGIERGDRALRAGLYWTDDAAVTWLGLGKDIAGKEVQAIAVMPALPRTNKDATTVGSVVCIATGTEIYRSVDNGRSWLRLDWRGVDTRILSLAIHPDNPDVIYVGTQGDGIYSTQNGGALWTEMNQGLDDWDIYDITIALADPHLMYLATNGGVYRSTNAGLTWIKPDGATNGRRVNAVVVHPRDGNLVYAGLQHGAVCYSTDGGQHWTPMKRGLGDITVFSLALACAPGVDAGDPATALTLWAGTADGIWRYVSETPAFTATSVNPTASTTPSPTLTMTMRPSNTASPTKTLTSMPTLTPTMAKTLSPTVLQSGTQTATRTRPPAPIMTPTFTPTLPPAPTATTVPPPPLPTATRTAVPR